MKTFCVYHKADFDGQCAAAIIAQKFPDAVLVPFDYGCEINTKQFINNKVIFVDCALQPFSLMESLALTCDLTWIDHHKTAIEEYEKSLVIYNDLCDIGIIHAHVDIKFSGCELAWKWAFPETQMPEAVRLVGRYDIWDLSVPEAWVFQCGLRTLELDPLTGNGLKNWHEVFGFHNWINELLKIGREIQKYSRNHNKDLCKSAFEANVAGLRCICLNVGRASSQVFESMWDKEKYDAMLAFCNVQNKFWKITLYTDKEGIDVGAVAKSMGGGGHKQAAGWQFDTLPQELMPKGK